MQQSEPQTVWVTESPKSKEPFYNPFWFPWLILTLIYLGLFSVGSFTAFPTNIIGFFVPFGFFNTAISISTAKAIITFPLLILSFFYVDYLARKLKVTTPVKRLLFNLLWLLLLTLAVDLILYGRWISLYALFGE